MIKPSRRISLWAAALLGLIGLARPAAADWCSQSRTYYQPVTVAASPSCNTCCAPPATSALVPVTVTTTRYGLFGLRHRTTVSYGAPVPVAAPAPVLAAPPVLAVPPGPPSYYAAPIVVP
jgi:hypothetical protein